jgi:FMN phosphatase YigB (HAD superfamily)
MIKAIVFDCFGVLVGSSFWDIYRAGGGDTDKDEAFIDEMLGRANAALISGEDFTNAIARRLGISPEAWLTLNARMQQPNEELWAYIQAELKPHYKIAMLSNANRGAAERRVPAEKRALLDTIVVSGEVGCMKPEREIYILTAERLGVAFSEMIFTDDIQEYVDAAESFGIKSIRYRDLVSFRRQLEALLQPKR